jgi:hypothetical protein
MSCWDFSPSSATCSGDASGEEPAQSAFDKACCCEAGLVRENLNIGEPGRVVDGDMDEIPAAPRFVLRASR